jgi:hypothetical protein
MLTLINTFASCFQCVCGDVFLAYNDVLTNFFAFIFLGCKSFYCMLNIGDVY